MRAKVRAGPEPQRLRLDCLAVEELTESFRQLLESAKQGRSPPAVAPQRLIEAIQVAHDAIRARVRLNNREPVPVRWLAALGNVATSRVRNIIRDGNMWRTTGGVDPQSAEDWLRRERMRRVRSKHPQFLSAAPSWWERCPRKLVAYAHLFHVVEDLVPSPCQVTVDGMNTVCIAVPPDSPLDDDELEELRTRVRNALEPYEAPESWPPFPETEADPEQAGNEAPP